MTGDGSGNVYLSGKYQASTGNMGAMVRKLNSSGSVLWTKTFGTTAYDDVGVSPLLPAAKSTSRERRRAP